jgi:hypothetical protein
MELGNMALAKVRESRKGQTLTEYSFVLFFVGLAAYSAYTGLGIGLKTFANGVVSLVSAAVAAL